MSKKVNITRDIESRRQIARMRPGTNVASMPEKATPNNEQPKTQRQDTAPVDASGRDKKPGRKAEGKP